jgi:LytS/YehU family sensor histidine kinase
VTANSRDSASIEDEVTFVEGYVSLQRMRYGDRLDFSCAVEPEALALECLPLMLQPLVENAIRHGLECCTGPCRIVLAAGIDGDAVVVTVRNDLAAGVPANAGLGIGLANIRDRLAAAFGDRASLAAERLPDAFVATIRLPVEWPAGTPT